MPILSDDSAGNDRSSRRLLIFSKIPMPGGAKTRLVPPLSEQEASDLARAFLLDALESLSDLPGIDSWLYLTISWGDRRTLEESLPELFRSPLKKRITWRMQSGADLGERLDAAFADAFADGCSAAVAVGSDHPTLPVGRISEAFAALASHDITIGPADDGGYYLIGMRRHLPEVLLDLPYSTSRLFDEAMAVAAKHGLRSSVLEQWYDVDDAASFERLRNERASLAPESHTAALLALLDRRSEACENEARESR
jgi:uncharacterized protein